MNYEPHLSHKAGLSADVFTHRRELNDLRHGTVRPRSTNFRRHYRSRRRASEGYCTIGAGVQTRLCRAGLSDLHRL